MENLDARFEFLRAATINASPSHVDSQQRVIRGFIVAEIGPFKTGRGEFNMDSLQRIVALMNAMPEGVPVNLGHHDNPGARESLDAFLGRARNARIVGDAVRADLYLDPSAFLSHNGGVSVGDRLLVRAKSDPKSFGTSLVLTADKMRRAGSLPPLWMPTRIQSSDLVAVGDAVHSGFLTAPHDPELDALRARHAARQQMLEPDDDLLRLRWRNQKRKLGLN